MRKVISIIKNAFIQFTMYEEHHSVIECMAKKFAKKRGKDYDKAELSSTKKRRKSFDTCMKIFVWEFSLFLDVKSTLNFSIASR